MNRNLRLLLTESQVLWGTDAWGRYEEPPLCAVAVSATAGWQVIIGPSPGRGLSARLRQLLADAARAGPAAGLRPLLAPAVQELASAGITAGVHGGPSFVAEPPLPEAGPRPAASGDGSVRGSASASDVRLVGSCQRPPSWDEAEWPVLLAGRLGPWAMLVGGDQVLSICHTPRDSPAGAEAGVWTDPACRGRGYACRTTMAWARLMRERDGRQLFYSTADVNLSSRHVAARLGLPGIGWIWTLRACA